MKRRTFYFTALVLGMAWSAANAGDVNSLMKGCNDCHGKGGVSQSADVPTLAGYPEFLHLDTLYVYQDEARPCIESKYRHGDTSRPATTMCAVAANLSEEDIDAIAAAYAGMDYVKMKQDFDAALAATGEALHNDRCDKCHSEAGTNPDDEAGLIGGQPIAFLRRSFDQFAEDSRPQPKKMKEVFGELAAEDLDALANYYGSIQ